MAVGDKPETTLLAVVCANGLGHFRRVIGVFDRLLAQRSVSLTIACEKWQIERTATWPALQRVQQRARFVYGVTQPGVQWRARAHEYGEELFTWENRLLEHTAQADIVVCDNLPGALAVRPDTVLMGSFLWADVLEHAHGSSAEVRQLVARDRALIAEHRPPMLCVGDIAMPAVLSSTAAVPLPWMCEKTGLPARALSADRPRVGVFGGATGSASEVLEAAAKQLEGRYIVERGGEAEARYETYDLVVCRPGIGTVTGCIADRVPMVLAYEPANLELAHNAARLASLGVALDCGTNAGAETIAEAVERALDPVRHRAASETMAQLGDGGLDAAARWLAAML